MDFKDVLNLTQNYLKKEKAKKTEAKQKELDENQAKSEKANSMPNTSKDIILHTLNPNIKITGSNINNKETPVDTLQRNSNNYLNSNNSAISKMNQQFTNYIDNNSGYKFGRTDNANVQNDIKDSNKLYVRSSVDFDSKTAPSTKYNTAGTRQLLTGLNNFASAYSTTEKNEQNDIDKILLNADISALKSKRDNIASEIDKNSGKLFSGIIADKDKYNSLLEQKNLLDRQISYLESSIYKNKRNNIKSEYEKAAKTAIDKSRFAIDKAAENRWNSFKNSGMREVAHLITDDDYLSEQTSPKATADEWINTTAAKIVYLTDEQKNTLKYLLSTGDEDSFKKYYSAVEYDLNKSRTDILREKASNISNKSWIAGAAISAASTAGGAASYVGGITDYVKSLVDSSYLGPDANSELNALTNFGDTAAQTANEKANTTVTNFFKDKVGLNNNTSEILGKTAEIFSSAGVSISQMLPALAFSAFGGGAVTALMSLSSAGSSVAQNQGDGKAAGNTLLSSTIDGMVEFATEYLPIDNLLKIATSGKLISKKAIRDILIQGGAEGGEELVSEYLGVLNDISINGGNSEYELYKKQLIDDGLSDSEAAYKANIQFFITNPIKSFSAGALSGLAMGSGAVISSHKFAKQVELDTDNRLAAINQFAATASTPDEIYSVDKICDIYINSIKNAGIESEGLTDGAEEKVRSYENAAAEQLEKIKSNLENNAIDILAKNNNSLSSEMYTTNSYINVVDEYENGNAEGAKNALKTFINSNNRAISTITDDSDKYSSEKYVKLLDDLKIQNENNTQMLKLMESGSFDSKRVLSALKTNMTEKTEKFENVISNVSGLLSTYTDTLSNRVCADILNDIDKLKAFINITGKFPIGATFAERRASVKQISGDYIAETMPEYAANYEYYHGNTKAAVDIISTAIRKLRDKNEKIRQSADVPQNEKIILMNENAEKVKKLQKLSSEIRSGTYTPYDPTKASYNENVSNTKNAPNVETNTSSATENIIHLPGNSTETLTKQENNGITNANNEKLYVPYDVIFSEQNGKYIAKIKRYLTADQYNELKAVMVKAGGAYSKAAKGFIFTKNPSGKLTGKITGLDSNANEKLKSSSSDNKQETVNIPDEKNNKISDNIASGSEKSTELSGNDDKTVSNKGNDSETIEDIKALLENNGLSSEEVDGNYIFDVSSNRDYSPQVKNDLSEWMDDNGISKSDIGDRCEAALLNIFEKLNYGIALAKNNRSSEANKQHGYIYDAVDVKHTNITSAEENALNELLKYCGNKIAVAIYTENNKKSLKIINADAPMNAVAMDVPLYGSMKSNQDTKSEAKEVSDDKIIATSSSDKSADNRSNTVAEWVYERLTANKPFKREEIQKYAESVWGGTLSENALSVKDINDAMELGLNRFILELEPSDKRYSVSGMLELQNSLPTQTNRSDGQIAFQQFSTPPAIAFVANYAANIQKGEVMLEPSGGIGGIAVFAKHDGAETYINELDPRRLSIVKNLPFDGFFNENAEQLDNILGDKIKPSVIVMNPPFSSSATRNTKDTKIASIHISEALKTLDEGGRLVAIVGRGMNMEAAAFRSWWADIKSRYNVRANIGLSGDNYTKFGTSFGIQLLVIDKTGATDGEIVTGNVSKVEELKKLVEDIRNDRKITEESDGRSEESGGRTDSSRGTDGESGDGTPLERNGQQEIYDRGESYETRSDVSESSVRKQSPTDGGMDVTVRSGTSGMVADGGLHTDGRPVRDVGNRRDAGNETEKGDGNNSREPSDAIRRGGEQGLPGGHSGQDGLRDDGPVNMRDDVQHSDGGKSEIQNDSRPVRPIQLNDDLIKSDDISKPTKRRTVTELSDSMYDEYVPHSLSLKGAKHHPTKVSESSAMAAVESPELTYVPKIPQKLIDSGDLSDIQLEAISYAGQSFTQKLASGKTRGFFIGDGTGIGKGREISGILLDSFNNGAKKAVWVTINNGLAVDTKRDLKVIFGSDDMCKQFIGGSKTDKFLNDIDSGILFATYGALSRNYTKNDSNLNKIAKWLGKDFDGVIVFDESHKMGNTTGKKGKRGTTKASDTALAGITLQELLPNAKIVYSSATGATEVSNLLYATRLGLWGEGTPYSNGLEFVNKISSGGIAAMEVVARSMKARGLYLSRNLSYDGVSYRKITHNLTKSQISAYDAAADTWDYIAKGASEAMNLTKSKNAASQLWNTQQKFFSQIVTSMQIPSLISDIEKQLENGNSAIIQLTSTNEAGTDRAIDNSISETGDKNDKSERIIEDFDSSPREMVIEYLEKSFPVYQYEEYKDENGNIKTREVLDSGGNKVINREAQKIRDTLIAKMADLKISESPIDQIINYFGTDSVAENSGRTKRAIRQPDGTHKIVPFSDSAKSNDVNAFQNGDKRIIIFSKAGGTGKSYHADRNAKNQQRRIHYLLQPGWQADNAVQGLGRSHRSNEAVPPEFVLLTTDIPGQKRFVSTIARRLDQLGALTKGQRDTGSQGIFKESDNLENSYAANALSIFYRTMDSKTLNRMGINLYDKYGNINESSEELHDMRKFLNRLFMLDFDEQNRIFSMFDETLSNVIESAKESGTYESGMENYKADKVHTDSLSEIDNGNGAVTQYYILTASNKTKILKFDDIKTEDPRFDGFFRNIKSGNIYAMMKTSDITDKYGNITATYRRVGQREGASILITRAETMNTQRYERVTDIAEARKAWDLCVSNLPETTETKLHVIGGEMLSVWDKLPESNVKIRRFLLDDGNVIIGRIIDGKNIESTLRRLNITNEGTSVDVSKAAYTITHGGYVTLSKGWTISQRIVSGEKRVEIKGLDYYTYSNIKDRYGLFTEMISYRPRFFIPNDGNLQSVLERLFLSYPVSDISYNADDSEYRSKSASENYDNQWARTEQNKTNKSKASDGKISGKKIDSNTPVYNSVNDIIKEITARFGIPISTGRTGSPNALGLYRFNPETIRTRISMNLPVIDHELGHHIGETIMNGDYNALPGFDKIVDDNSASFSEKGYDKSEFGKEAFAEFIRVYLSSDKSAREKYGEFYKAFVDYFTAKPEKQNNANDTKQSSKELEQEIKEWRERKSVWESISKIADSINNYMSASIDEREQTYMQSHAYNSRSAQFQRFIKNNPAAAAKKLADNFTQKWLNQYAKLRDVELNVTGDCKVYREISRLTRLDNIVSAAVTDGLVDIQGNKVENVASLKDIVARTCLSSRQTVDFERYLKLLHALELDQYKIRTFDDPDLQNAEFMKSKIAELENANPTFKNGAEEIYAFQKAVLWEYGVKCGTVSKQLFDELQKKYKNYVPFFRVIDVGYGNGIKSSVADQNNPLKYIKGSGRPTYSILENIFLNTSKIIKTGSRNICGSDFATMVEGNKGCGWVMERISPDTVESVQNSADADPDNTAPEEQTSKTAAYRIKGSKSYDVISIMQNGEKIFYQVHDENVLNALVNLHPSSMNDITQTFRWITNNVKLLTTGNNPFFGVINVVRDYQTGYISSKTVYNPIKYASDWFSALKNVLANDEIFTDYERMGGSFGGVITENSKTFSKTMRDIRNVERSKLKLVFKSLANVGDNIMRFINAGESVTRLAEYKRTLNSTGDKTKAAYNAARVTVDFTQHGTASNVVDAYVLYFKATVNSLDQLAHVLALDYKEDGVKSVIGSWSKMLGPQIILAGLLQLWNRVLAPSLFGGDDDDDKPYIGYDDLSSYIKNRYWAFSTGDGKFIRIPKPQSYGAVGSLTERTLDKIITGDNKFDGFGDYLMNLFIPAFDITIAGSIMAIRENKSWSGSPIVYSNMDNLDNRLQYNENTMAPAVWIGKWLNQSPMQIQYFIQQNTGFIGKIIGYTMPISSFEGDTSVADKAMVGLKKSLMAFPQLFYADSVYSNDIVNSFYEDYNKYYTNYKSYEETSGEDERYTLNDVYNYAKYRRFAELYSRCNTAAKEETDNEKSREIRFYINGLLSNLNKDVAEEFDKTMLDMYKGAVSEGMDVDMSDFSPYVSIPQSITYQNQKYELDFEDSLLYFQVVFNDLYGEYLRVSELDNYSDAEKVAYLIDYKNEAIKTYKYDELWMGGFLKQKYAENNQRQNAG